MHRRIVHLEPMSFLLTGVTPINLIKRERGRERGENAKAPCITKAWLLRIGTLESHTPWFKSHLATSQLTSFASEPQFANRCHSLDIGLYVCSHGRLHSPAGSVGLYVRCFETQYLLEQRSIGHIHPGTCLCIAICYERFLDF